MVENNYMPMGCVIMDIWAAVIFAAALSIDSFGIGFSCSLRGIRIPLRCKLIICGVSVIVTAAATVTGYLASDFLPEHAGNGGSIPPRVTLKICNPRSKAVDSWCR